MFNVAVAADNPAAAANTATEKTIQTFHTPEHIEIYIAMDYNEKKVLIYLIFKGGLNTLLCSGE